MSKTAMLGAAVAAAVSWSSATLAESDQAPHATMMTPGKAIEMQIGDHHAISYFNPGKDVCGLTVVMASSAGNAAEVEAHGTRIRVDVAPGHSFNIDGTDKKSVEFACRPGGQKMTVRPFDRSGYVGQKS